MARRLTAHGLEKFYMKHHLVVGVVVADDTEYAPIAHLKQVGLKSEPFFGKAGHSFTLQQGERTVTVHCIQSGIGKVNAAAAATHLLENGCRVLLNYGLSGGVGRLPCHSFALGTEFVEHDFDLTCLGRPRGQKPGQPLFCKAGEALNSCFLAALPSLYAGPMACGDCFVSSNQLRDWLRDDLNVICCDMETAAIAGVANLYGVPFAALRQVSDDAGDAAAADYSANAAAEQVSLFETFLKLLWQLFGVKELWEVE